MKKKEMHYDWLKFRWKWHLISSFSDFPALLLLYYLGYMVGFWIILGMIILNGIIMGVEMHHLKKKCGLGA